MTDIFSILKSDHDLHRAMLAKIAETSGDTAERRDLFEAFRIEVTAHAAAEEQSLYATMLGDRSLMRVERFNVVKPRAASLVLLVTGVDPNGTAVGVRNHHRKQTAHRVTDDGGLLKPGLADISQDVIADRHEQRRVRIGAGICSRKAAHLHQVHAIAVLEPVRLVPPDIR